jgi:hypothetical protein
MDKIKRAVEEFLEELASCCEQLKFEIEHEKKAEKEYHVRINNDLLRVYDTKKGINPDMSVMKNKEIGNKVLGLWEELYGKEYKNSTYTYKGIKQFDIIINKIKEFESHGGCRLQDKKVNNSLVKIVKDIDNENTHEKLTLTYYNNQTLTVQGFEGVLWENICQIIEKNEGLTQSKNILKRIKGNDDVSNESEYENNLKEILTEEIFNFLSTDDKEYLITAHELIMEEKLFKIYTPVLCSAALALEGYLKVLLIKLKLVKTLEVSQRSFNFGSVFNGKILLGKHYNELKQKYNNYDEIKKQLEFVYSKIKSYRDTVCHSGAGVSMYTLKVKSFEKCKKLYYDEYIKTIKSSYEQIFLS